ncbi:polysaccharide biosynthesis C-terminal domain-containing protein, partial [Clostridium sp.]
ITVLLAVWGLLIGEAASAVFCLLVYGCSKSVAILPNANTPITPLLLPLLTMALPLMANRLTLSFLQSLEAIFVPNQLLLSGLSRVESVSIYGVLTGMALPFVLFPSAITNSLAVVLLPAVSEAQAQNQPDKIEHTISMALRYSLYMGILCVGLFTRFGPALGETFYHNADAGRFIQILSWLCPFLYLSTTMGSILNGLGKTGTVFVHHTVSMLLTLSLVLFAIPRWGIFAYLAALLISELVLAFLHIHALACEVPIRLPLGQGIVKPVFCLLTALGILQGLERSNHLLHTLFTFETLPHLFPSVLFQAGGLCLLYAGGLLLLHKKI